MKSDNPIEKITGALKLSTQQQEVLSALRSRDTERFHLSSWYLGALYALNNPYNPDRISQAAQSLRELIEKLPRILGIGSQSGSHGFKGWRDNLRSRFEKDKEKYAQGWKGHKINAHLGKTLEQIDSYLERNKQPTRREQIQDSLARIDPLANLFDKEIRDAKRDQLFHVWNRFEGFAHHKVDSDFDEFMRNVEALERIVIDLLAPITAEDQQEILSIINQPDRSESDVSRLLMLIKRRGANYSFFFEHVSDAAWLPILEKEDFFSHPPGSEPIDEQRSDFPIWIPVRYLSKVAKDAPSEVVCILSSLPSVDNPWVYDGILKTALQLSGSQSARLKDKMIEYARLEFQIMAHEFAILIAHWTAENETSAALELTEILIQFQSDPRAREKRDRYRKDSSDLLSVLDSSPRFEKWDYRDILNSGVRPLAVIEPYKTACLLIDAVAAMIDLGVHPEQLDTIVDRDTSEFWCRRLGSASIEYGDNKENLANALTFACEQVYKKAPASIENLDGRLRKQRWKIFKRLRQHLFALNPSEVTKPWIRNLILEHQDYGRTEHHHEFQAMVRSACAHFGEELLTKQERVSIFKTILDGPPKEEFLKRHGEKLAEEKFELRQLCFHRMQLRLFEDVLFGDYLARFQETELQADEQISNDDYLPVGDVKGGFVSDRSPKPAEQLATMDDAELLKFINEWDAEHYDDVDPLVEITIEALAKAFQEFFADAVLPNADRLHFWNENRGEIARPIYVRAIVDGMKDALEGENFERLEESLEFCEWVLLHPDQEREEDFGNGDQSRDFPLWASSRRAVSDLIDTCIKRDVNVPYSNRGRLADLLGKLCTQFDWRLDCDHPVLLERNDQFTEAINNTRSRALQSLIKFGSWIREYNPNASLGAVTRVLEKRLSAEAQFPLTLPEHAILGANYAELLFLNMQWASEHKPGFFPQHSLSEWQEAFGCFLRYTPANKPSFTVLQDDYRLAVNQLAKFKGREDSESEFSDYLGRHLFMYYLWGFYPLQGEESLLEGFYEGTKSDRTRWSNLVRYLGERLVSTVSPLDEDLRKGMADYFEWRLQAGNADELSQFSTWLRAECLDADWRLNAYSRVLSATKDSSTHGVMIVADALEKMLPDHTNKVLECFAKLTDTTTHSTFYVRQETAKNIIRAGLESADEHAQSNATRAHENLLRKGYSDLLNLDD